MICEEMRNGLLLLVVIATEFKQMRGFEIEIEIEIDHVTNNLKTHQVECSSN